eukprot:gb/GECG01008427.1/.p1 GENE.gb/GECG01008427.1/~~gb/GECG01008427.1/.p1  ORF type:complete len:651 (+),score=97.17 gb/GECG01008427.1/:1-1953(+)
MAPKKGSNKANGEVNKKHAHSAKKKTAQGAGKGVHSSTGEKQKPAGKRAREEETQKSTAINSHKKAKKEGEKTTPKPKKEEDPALYEAKLHWNKLRMKNTAKEERHRLISKIFEVLGDKLGSVAMKHDASRVMQSVMQHGTDEQRHTLLKAIGSKFVPLAKSKYGHQLVQKCLRYGSKELKEKILREFRGNVVRLATHHLGALTLEEGYVHGWTSSQAWSFYRELYGPDINLLPETSGADSGREEVRSLGKIFEKHPEVKKVTLDHMSHVIQKAANKALLSLTFLHRLLQDYMEHASTSDKRKFVTNITDASVALVSSKAGARAVILALGYGTTKDRKAILQTIKPHALEMATHDQGHLVLLKALACVDDTVLLRKSVLKGFNPDKKNATDETNPLRKLCMDQYGKKVLLFPLAPNCRTYFTQFDLEMTKHNRIAKDEENGDVEENLECTSKKDDQLRRKELLDILQPMLQPICLANSRFLIMNQNGGDVLLEATWQWGLQDVVGDLCEVLGEQLTNVKDGSDATEVENSTPLLHHPSAHLFLKRLILREARTEDEELQLPRVGGKEMYLGGQYAERVSVCEPLFEQIKKHVRSLLKSNRGAFLITALLESPRISKKLIKMVPRQLTLGENTLAGQKVLSEAITKLHGDA